jgi:hypothetical protein
MKNWARLLPFLCVSMFARPASAVDPAVVHDINGRLMTQPPYLGQADLLRVCLRGAAKEGWKYSLHFATRPTATYTQRDFAPTDSGLCAVADRLAASDDAFFVYRISAAPPNRDKAGPDGRAPNENRLDDEIRAAYVALNERVGALLKEAGSAKSALFAEPGAAERSKVLADDLIALEAIRGSAEKAANAASVAPHLATLTDTIVTLRELKQRVDAATALGNADSAHAVFSGEIPLGRYRRAVALEANGRMIGGGTSFGLPLKSLDQALLYVQRSAASRYVYTVSADRGNFVFDSKPSSADSPADWILDRVAEGANFKGGTDIKVTVEQPLADGKKETLGVASIPVVETYRWVVNVGLYVSRIERQQFFTDADRVIGIDRRRGTGASAVFVTYYPRARVALPGKPVRAANFIPGIVFGTRLDSPTKEVLYGLGFEPTRGFQISFGFAQGPRLEPAPGFEPGKTLQPMTAQTDGMTESVPANGGTRGSSHTVVITTTAGTLTAFERWSKPSPFVAFGFDVRILGDTLNKLISKF